MDKASQTRTIELDFSPLLENGKRFAVHCETKADALHFLACLRKQYPEKCSGWDRRVVAQRCDALYANSTRLFV